MRILSAIAVSVLAAGAAHAQSPGSPVTFDDLDTDRNGQIDVREAEADMRVLESFNRLDTNGDGLLSSDEFSLFGELEQ